MEFPRTAGSSSWATHAPPETATCSAAPCERRWSTWREARWVPACRSRRERTERIPRCTFARRARLSRSFRRSPKTGPAGIPPGPSSALRWLPASSASTAVGSRNARVASGSSFRQRPDDFGLLLVGFRAIQVVQLLLDAFADVAGDVLDLALQVVELAFALELAVTRRDADGLLDLALRLVQSAFEILLVHVSLLSRLRWTQDELSPSLGLAGGNLLRSGQERLVGGKNIPRIRVQAVPRSAPALQRAGGGGPGVVRDQGAGEVAVEPAHQLREVAGSQLDVQNGIEELGGADFRRRGIPLQQPLRRRRHQLHEPPGAHRGYGDRVEMRLDLDHRRNQRRIEAVPPRLADDRRHHPAALVAPERGGVLHPARDADALGFPEVGKFLLARGERFDPRSGGGKLRLRPTRALVRPPRGLQRRRRGEREIRRLVAGVGLLQQPQRGARGARAADEDQEQCQRTAPAGRGSTRTASRPPPPDFGSRDSRPPRRRPRHPVPPGEPEPKFPTAGTAQEHLACHQAHRSAAWSIGGGGRERLCPT